MKDSYKINSGKSRTIPKSTMVDIQTEANHKGELSAANLAVIAALGEELNNLGIIRPVETMIGIRSEEELETVFKEAEAKSLGEEELNSEFHDARLDARLMGIEGTSNPLMEKFDDYEGLDYNPAFRARGKFEELLQNSQTKKKRRKI